MNISQLESGLLKKQVGENDENHKLNSVENHKETGFRSLFLLKKIERTNHLFIL